MSAFEKVADAAMRLLPGAKRQQAQNALQSALAKMANTKPGQLVELTEEELAAYNVYQEAEKGPQSIDEARGKAPTELTVVPMAADEVHVVIFVKGRQGSGKSRVAQYIRGMLRCLETIGPIRIKLEIDEVQVD